MDHPIKMHARNGVGNCRLLSSCVPLSVAIFGWCMCVCVGVCVCVCVCVCESFSGDLTVNVFACLSIWAGVNVCMHQSFFSPECVCVCVCVRCEVARRACKACVVYVCVC